MVFDIIQEIITHQKDCTRGDKDNDGDNDYEHSFFIWIYDFIKTENMEIFKNNSELMKWAAKGDE